MIAWLLELADSSTALGAISVGVAVIVLLQFSAVRRKIRIWVTFATVIAVGVSVPEVREFILGPLFGMLGRDFGRLRSAPTFGKCCWE